MDLSSTISAGPRHRIHSRVRVPRDSRPYFTVSDSRLLFSSPPTTHRATLQVFDPTSRRGRLDQTELYLDLSLSLSLMLQPTVSRPVYLGIKQPSGDYDQIFIIVRQLRVCWCSALSLTRGRVWSLQLLLVVASAVILGPESLGIRDHILLSRIWDFHFCRLLLLAGLRWSHSTPPPHGIVLRSESESETYVTNDGQSVSLSFNKAPIWVLRPDFYYY
jgi:hypothetical protein